MKEEEIIETFKHWIEYEKANKDKINKADELIEIQQSLLDLYEKEKEKNNSIEAQRLRDMCYKTDGDYISKDKILNLILKYRCFGWHDKDDEYWANRILDGFEQLL